MFRLAFATRAPVRSWAVLTLFVPMVGLGFAVPDVYAGVQRARRAVSVPIALNVYVSNAVNDGCEQVVFVVAAMMVGLLNCLVLRSIGCQFLRPGKSRITADSISWSESGSNSVG